MIEHGYGRLLKKMFKDDVEVLRALERLEPIHLVTGVEESLSSLNTRNEFVLRKRYGIDPFEPMTLKEIGQALHLSGSMIGIIEKKAFLQLRSSYCLSIMFRNFPDMIPILEQSIGRAIFLTDARTPERTRELLSKRWDQIFGVTDRTAEILGRMGLVYINDIVCKTEPERHLGRESFQELTGTLSHYGLELNGTLPPNPQILFQQRWEQVLWLSKRTRDMLKLRGLIFIGDIVKMTEDELLSTPNFGRKHMKELKDELSEFGLVLKRNSASNMLSRRLDQVLRLSKRITSLLMQSGLVFVGDVVQMTEEDLRSIPNFGQRLFKALQHWLSIYGLTLNMTLPDWVRPEE